VLTASLALGGGIMLMAVRSYTGDVVAASSSPAREESAATVRGGATGSP
jgi:hypothetical protein